MRGATLAARLRKNRFFYLMLLPIAAYFIVFNYYPLALGIYNSLRKVKLLGGSQFIGLTNYRDILAHPLYRQAFVNTLIVGALSFALTFCVALLLALMINEIRHKPLKSAVQSVTYLPYLLSWAVVGGIWMSILSPTGLVNGVMRSFAGADFRPTIFMAEPRLARAIMIVSGAWKNAGYYAVLLLAGIVSIDPSLYEAAAIDGASRLKQLILITVPNIVPTIKVIFMLGVMGLLRNFDQIYVMGNSAINDKVRNLLALIYEQGIAKFQIGPATAAATVVLLATLLLSAAVRKLIRYDETYE
ncbi:ABC transporter permease subunit [Bacillota bacterium Meth-B3]